MRKALTVIFAMTLTFATTLHAQIVTTIAGNGLSGFSGDSGLAINAQIFGPIAGLISDVSGNLYFSDHYNNRVRKINALTGIITTIAGNGLSGFSGDGGLAINAKLTAPRGLCIDMSGNLYIADYINHRIRKVDALTGVITTIAGNGDLVNPGDGGLAINSGLAGPLAICIDPMGNLYISTTNYRVRKINALTGIITTIAGTGIPGSIGDSGLATNAQIYNPQGICIDLLGNIYLAEGSLNRIRKVDAVTGIITTIAGSDSTSNLGDGGLAINASFSNPTGISCDQFGNLYVADRLNQRVRKINALTGIITTIAGNGLSGFSGDGGLSTSSQLSFPSDVFVDISGNVYIDDPGNARIRKIIINQTVLVNIINFDAVVSSDYKSVNVNWTTASQINNNYFEVERSLDCVHWQSVGKINGCGTCSSIMNYSFTDQKPLPGLSYYRLKQVDNDGKITFSKIVSIKRNKTEIKVVPYFTNSYSILGIEPGVNVALYNINGSLLMKKVSNSSSYIMDLSQYPNGCYIIHIDSKEINFSQKIIK